MKRIYNFFTNYWPLLGIFLICFFVGYQNVEYGTYLSGWDNLHPEFDFFTNIKRAFFAVWQEYQGLGVLGGNAHGTELFRELLLWPISLIVPQWFLRYGYHLGMWFAGGVGAYYLLLYLLENKKNNSLLYTQTLGFLGSTFYLLNLGTLQNFYAPYESFSHNYACLPWLVLALYRYLDQPNNKQLFIFAVVNFLAIPMFYIPTIFIVYCLIVGIICAVHLVRKTSQQVAKNCISVIAVIMLINSFWLLPFAYFVGQGTEFVKTATINSVFTDEAFLRNQQFGSIFDVMILRGFWFSNTDLMSNSGQNDFMMKPWISHLQNPLVITCLYLYFTIILAGVYFLFKKKHILRWSLTGLFILSLFALLNNNWPTGWLFSLLQEILPIFKQVFRLPYTKFIVLASLTNSILLTFGIDFLASKVSSPRIQKIVFLIIFCCFILTSLPSFSGNFFYEKMRVAIPNEYFAVFNFFQESSDRGKVAYLPQPTFWGWMTYDWGYRGSGFPWYGVPQPILDRAFDVWSTENESYYHELSYALYETKDPQIILQVLDKYQVNFVWIDTRIISPHKPLLTDLIFLDEVLRKNDIFVKKFDQGGQTIYERKIPFSPVTSTKTVRINEKNIFGKFDTAYASKGNYISASNSTEVSYPLLDLDSLKHSWKMVDQNGLAIAAPLSAGELTLTSLDNQWTDINLRIVKSQNNQITLSLIQPQVNIDGQKLPTTTNNIEVDPVISNNTEYIKVGDKIFETFNLPQTIATNFNSDIEFYSANDVINNDISSYIFTSNPTNCSITDTDNLAYKVQLTKDQELHMTGDVATKPCVFNKINRLVDKTKLSESEGLLDIIITFKAAAGTHLDLCLTKEGNNSCLYTATALATVSDSSEWSTFQYSFPSYIQNLDEFWLKMEANTVSTEKSEVYVSSIVLRTLKTTTKSTSLKNIFETATFQKNPLIVADSNMLYFPIQKDITNTILLANKKIDAQNCYPFGNGTYKREIISEETNFVRYSANNASSCETIYLGNDFNSGALLNLRTRNISGRPLKVCIRHDPPGDCIREFILNGTKNTWITQSIIIPPISTEKKDLYLEIDNFGLGSEKRINDFESAAVTPIPYHFLKGITTSNVDGYLETTLEEIVSPNKITYFLYTATVHGPTTLSLNQGFRNGWIAYPSMRPWSHFEHFTYNNWSNAWKIPEGNWVVTIIFWPQLLSFIGYIILLYTSCILFLKFRNNDRYKMKETYQVINQSVRLFLQGKLPK